MKHSRHAPPIFGNNDHSAYKPNSAYPYDAGTDSDSDYTSPNADVDPDELIHSLRNQALFSDAPIGILTFTRIDEPQAPVYLPMVLTE